MSAVAGQFVSATRRHCALTIVTVLFAVTGVSISSFSSTSVDIGREGEKGGEEEIEVEEEGEAEEGLVSKERSSI